MPYLDPVAGAAEEALNLSVGGANIVGVTPGTVVAEKCLIPDVNKDLASLRHVTLTGNLVVGATSISETDIAKVDAITNGVAAASKALVLGTDLAVIGQCAKVVNKATNYTVLTTDSGTTFVATAADVVFTLPATALGLVYRFIVATAALSSGTGLSVSPNSADSITGNGFTVADNKDAICSGASDRAGDFLEVTGDNAQGWYITGVIGTWARES